MPLLWVCKASLAAAFTILRLASGQPQIAYPVNSQLPPVAYVHQSFEFIFSPSTFSSDNLDVSYALSNQPNWIYLDSDTRKLTGTPTSLDLGAPEFQLLASDDNGQTSSAVTLVVVERQTLSTAGGILTQLEQAGSISTPATLLLHPSESFNFNVTPRVFDGVSERTVFYAVSSDGSPLPSWMHFDPQAIMFTGTTLPLLTPGPTIQTYSFSLVASDVLGFSESNVDFTIVTTEHILAFNQPNLNVSVSRGGSVMIDSLLDQVSIDGTQVSRGEIKNIVSNPPAWLHLNSSDISYNGTAPDDVHNTSFFVALSSSGTNTANATIWLQVSEESGLGHVDLGTASVAAGTYFSFQLNRSSLSTMSSQVDVDFGQFASWLLYTVANQTIHGAVPSGLAGHTQSLDLTFNDTATIVMASLVLSITESPTTSSTISTMPGSTVTNQPATPSNTTEPGTTSSHSTARIYSTVLAVVLPTLAVVFLIWIVIMWLRKRRQQEEERARQNKIRHISSPRPGPPSGVDMLLPSSFSDAGSGIRMRQAANGAPRLELPWAPNSPTRTRRRRSRKPNLSQGGIIGPSWDDLLHFEHERRETPPPLPANDGSGTKGQQLRSPGRRAARKRSGGISKDFRPPRTVKTQNTKTTHAPGLPKRMSGAGHGAGSANVLMSPDLRSSWQTTQGSIPIMMDSRPSTVLLDAFPAPPLERSSKTVGKGRSESPQHGSKPTLRWVGQDSSSSNSFDAARQYYYEHNAWNRLAGTAPFGGTAFKIIPDPHRITATSGWSGGPSSDRGSRALASGSSLMWTRDGAADRDNPQYRTRLGPLSRGGYGESVASSRQFDSAASSDSQWEDENVTTEEKAIEKTSSRPWSHLPFEPSDEAQFDMSGGGCSGSGSGAGIGPDRPRLADQRRHVSVEATEVDNPASRSHKGSFRFV